MKMSGISYQINKGVNRPLEFRGLKAQYILYLAAGLALLLIVFAVLYITGVPVYLSVPLVLLAGAALFAGVYRYSHKYGEHGLMKQTAFRRLSAGISCRTRKVFLKLNTTGKKG